MPRPLERLNINEGYEHLERVEWPEDLPGPKYWIPDSTLLDGLPKELKDMVGRVVDSAKRFYQKAKRQPAPKISGDNQDPDAIHALQFALDRQDELEHAIKPSNKYPTASLMLWLQERKKSHVKSMQAVVVAEEGEMYDEANKEPWDVKLATMTNENIEHLRFIFRTVMARIDIAQLRFFDQEQIQPPYKEVIVKPGSGVNTMISFPPAPLASGWKMENSLMENSRSKMRQAALELYHQGRVLTAGRVKITEIKEPTDSVFAVIIRAMTLTICSIEMVWIERQKDLSKAEEERLLAWLVERKKAAVDLQLALMEFHLPEELEPFAVKIDSFGEIFKWENGKFVKWRKYFLL